MKPDGGATNKKVHNQTTKELKKSASDKRTAVKATSELQKSAIGFSSIVLDKTKSEKEQKRTLPRHISVATHDQDIWGGL